MPSPPSLITGYRPGLLGRLIALHGEYYHEYWGFDLSFEAQEAAELAEFMQRQDPARDLILSAWQGVELAGAVAVDGSPQDGEPGLARLRWFIVDPGQQGGGLGLTLLGQAVEFGRQAGHRGLYLWTFAGLDAARHLYEKVGFALAQERQVEQWGLGMVNEQRFDLTY